MNFFKAQKKIKANFLFSLLVFTITLFSGLPAQCAAIIKFATLAPEGSTWMEEMKNFTREVTKKSEGRIKFKIYSGGIQGDEKDVVRKMRIGQIHCAGFTGVGIGEIAPNLRILDTPFLFRNSGEIDYIYENFDKDFRKIFEKKGYILLGWAEVGIVNIFSHTPVKKPPDLGGLKMWIWEGDAVAQATFEALNIKPIPLSITDVMTSLETGMINGVYASPLSAIALQWFTKMKYALSLPIANSSGAVLITRKKFMSLGKKDRKNLLEAGKKYFSRLTKLSRIDNKKAIKTLKKNGITFTQPDADSTAKFEQAGKKARDFLIGKLYDEKFLKKIESALKKYRSRVKANNK